MQKVRTNLLRLLTRQHLPDVLAGNDIFQSVALASDGVGADVEIQHPHHVTGLQLLQRIRQARRHERQTCGGSSRTIDPGRPVRTHSVATGARGRAAIVLEPTDAGIKAANEKGTNS